MAFRRVLILANPIAGRGRGEERATALYAALLARDLDAQLFITSGSGEATLVARAAATGTITQHSAPQDPPVEPPPQPIGTALIEAQRDAAAFAPDLLISVGGDGTLRELLDGVAERPLPVGMLPMGTANVLALDFKLPRKPQALVDLVLKGTTRQLDLATVTGTHPTTGKPQTQTSFLAVGLGLDAEIVRRVDAARDGAITKWSYVPHAARAVLAHKQLELHVEIDGQPLTNPQGAPIPRVAAILLANVVNFGGIIKLDPATRSDDGEWELYFWEKARIPHLVPSFLRGLIGRFPGGLCQARRVREVRVTSPAPVFYHVDGDPGALLPLTLRVSDRRQPILAP